MCVSTLIREGREAEADEAIRMGRKAAADLGPYCSADDEIDSSGPALLRREVLADAAGILDAPNPINLERCE